MRINVRTGRDNGPSGLLSYPFVLQDGTAVDLWLPATGLTQTDADRLKRYLDSLVNEYAETASASA